MLPLLRLMLRSQEEKDLQKFKKLSLEMKELKVLECFSPEHQRLLARRLGSPGNICMKTLKKTLIKYYGKEYVLIYHYLSIICFYSKPEYWIYYIDTESPNIGTYYIQNLLCDECKAIFKKRDLDPVIEIIDKKNKSLPK